jgi:hypothetical protein
MPRFFFDYRTKGFIERDHEGLELPDLETAHREAILGAIDWWIEAVRERRDPCAHSLEMRDATDRVLKIVPLAGCVWGEALKCVNAG